MSTALEYNCVYITAFDEGFGVSEDSWHLGFCLPLEGIRCYVWHATNITPDGAVWAPRMKESTNVLTSGKLVFALKIIDGVEDFDDLNYLITSVIVPADGYYRLNPSDPPIEAYSCRIHVREVLKVLQANGYIKEDTDVLSIVEEARNGARIGTAGQKGMATSPACI